jgi:hypothetical protein
MCSGRSGSVGIKLDMIKLYWTIGPIRTNVCTKVLFVILKKLKYIYNLETYSHNAMISNLKKEFTHHLPEEECNMLLKDVGVHLPDYTAQ